MTVRLPVDLFGATPPTPECRLETLGSDGGVGQWCAPHGMQFPCRWALVRWLAVLSPVIQTAIRKTATWRTLLGCEAEFEGDDDEPPRRSYRAITPEAITTDGPLGEQMADVPPTISSCAELRQYDDEVMETLARVLWVAGLIEESEARPLQLERPEKR